MEHRLGDKVVAVAVCDLCEDGMSAVYTFFDPTLRARSLGVYSIMKQLDYVRDMNLDWLYLGYLVAGCKKMNYKTKFTPLFGYVNGEWRIVKL